MSPSLHELQLCTACPHLRTAIVRRQSYLILHFVQRGTLVRVEVFRKCCFRHAMLLWDSALLKDILHARVGMSGSRYSTSALPSPDRASLQLPHFCRLVYSATAGLCGGQVSLPKIWDISFFSRDTVDSHNALVLCWCISKRTLI